MDNLEDSKPENRQEDSKSENEFTPSARRSPGRRAQRQAQTRSDLLRAAQEIFTRVGLAEATIAQITEKADVGFGTFYLYFPSKEDAYRAVIVDGFAVLDEQLDHLIRQAKINNLAWKDVLEQVIQAFLHFASERQELFLMMFSGQESGAGQRVFVPIAMRMAGLLQEAQRDLSVQESLTHPREAEQKAGDSLPTLPLYTVGLLAEIIVTILNRTTRWWLRLQTQENSLQRPPSVEEVSALICKFIIVGLTGLFSPASDES